MKAIIIIPLFLLAGCVFWPPSREIEVGWTREAVHQNEGRPAWSWLEGETRVDVFQFYGNDVLKVRYAGETVQYEAYTPDGKKRVIIRIEWRVTSFCRTMSGYRD